MKKLLNKVVIYNTTLIIGVSIFITACTSPDAKREAEKIVDKQIKVLDKEQRAAEEMLEKVQDSIKDEESKLLARKEAVEKEISDFENRKRIEKISELNEEKAALKEELDRINDTLQYLKDELERLENEKELLQIKENQLATQKSEAKEAMITGIETIDKRLDQAEQQRIMKQQETDLSNKKIDLARQKIGVLEEEIRIYQREKNDLELKDAAESEIEDYENKIKEIQDEIFLEEKKIRDAENIIASNRAWMQDFAALKEEMSGLMEKEYDKKETIDSFNLREKNRLEKEMMSIENEQYELVQIQEELQAHRVQINDQLATLDEDIEILRSGELSDLLRRKSDLERQESMLAREELTMVQIEDTMISIEQLPDDTAVDILVSLEKELTNRRKDIERLKSEIAAEREQLAEKRAEINTRRARKVKTTTSVVIIILVIAAALAGLYFLGKRKQKKNKANS